MRCGTYFVTEQTRRVMMKSDLKSATDTSSVHYDVKRPEHYSKNAQKEFKEFKNQAPPGKEFVVDPVAGGVTLRELPTPGCFTFFFQYLRSFRHARVEETPLLNPTEKSVPKTSV